LLLVLILSAGFWAQQARADTLTVCAVGCDFSSVSTAVSAAASGDIIQLAGETFNENIVILKSVTLQGENGTILDGDGSSRVISVTNGVTVSLLSLTVQNGLADDGGGIFNRGNLTLAGWPAAAAPD
jgi:nitrous oxidase accessory protein NosD